MMTENSSESVDQDQDASEHIFTKYIANVLFVLEHTHLTNIWRIHECKAYKSNKLCVLAFIWREYLT